MDEETKSSESTAKKPGLQAHGRGARSNAGGRFENQQYHAFDDGWEDGLDTYGDLRGHTQGDKLRLTTRIHQDRSRSVIATNNSPDIGFDRSINPYRGCEHGCVYCFARPTHAFLGHSPGLDFETQIYTKPDAAKLLRRELTRPSYRPRPIAMGTNTDPYQPVERSLKITRSILETLAACHHPVTITTKSAGIIRDLDILGPMAARGLTGLALSVTSLDRDLARSMEPRASTPARRLAAISATARAGIPTAVMVAPVIPGLNDHELEAILEQAAAAGATAAGYILLRLPLEVSDLFKEWLEGVHPNRASRILRRLRDMRGGRDYRPDFGTRMTGAGPEALLLGERFASACRRLGLATSPSTLKTELFDKSAISATDDPDGRQLGLFDAT